MCIPMYLHQYIFIKGIDVIFIFAALRFRYVCNMILYELIYPMFVWKKSLTRDRHLHPFYCFYKLLFCYNTNMFIMCKYCIVSYKNLCWLLTNIIFVLVVLDVVLKQKAHLIFFQIISQNKNLIVKA